MTRACLRLGDIVVFAALALPACGGDDGSAVVVETETGTGGTAADATTQSSEASSTTSTTATSTTADSTTDPDTTDGDTSSTTGPPSELPHEDDFEGQDGAPWPAPWQQLNAAVLAAEIDAGRARLSGQTGAVARMGLPGYAELDTHVTVTVTFDDWSAQGFGFYVRQNGGALTETNPPGQGYAVFTEGGFEGGIGVWREIDGVEERLAFTPQAGIQAGVPYRIRFECIQNGDMTTLRAKMWPAADAEPAAWQVETQDGTAQLQGTAGSFAADIYNYTGTGSIYLDDLRIEAAG